MALSTLVREEVTAALAAALPVPVFASIPPVLTFPCVVLVPDSPYLVRDRLAALAYTVRLRVVCVAQALDNAAGLAKVEALVDEVLAALPPGAEASEVTPPALQDLGAQGSCYSSEVLVVRPAREERP